MKTINIGIVAHVDAGKTTTTENLLYYSGAIKSVGKVDLGSTQTDSMELERKRGITIKSSAISFTWNSVKVNIIDTPGHADFVSEVERSLNLRENRVPGQLLFMGKQLPIRCFMSAGSVLELQFCGMRGVVS